MPWSNPHSEQPHLDKARITGLVLAGGLGRRVGGRDKGLIEFRGQMMIAHVLSRLRPQVGEVLINANRNSDSYAQFGHRIVSDVIKDHAGPLAGLETGLLAARNDLVVSVPCDTPFLPCDLVARLYRELALAQADVAIAKTGEQLHPVFCLVRRSAHRTLKSFLDAGGRRADNWFTSLRVVQVAFDDQSAAFANINTLDDLQHWERHD